jgi:Lrp/AsnC family leucine-responsive transcriptional regulator
MVAGGFDYLLKTRAADMSAYRSFAGAVLWQLPGPPDSSAHCYKYRLAHVVDGLLISQS